MTLTTKKEKIFEKGFLVNETNLRKIYQTISEKVKDCEETPPPIKFTVNRSNNSDFETNDVEQVIAENNYETEAITKINISWHSSYQCKDDLFILITVGSERVTLFVDGDNKSIVNSLNEDLVQFIQNEICTLRKAPATFTIPIIYYFILVLLIGSVVFLIAYYLLNPPTTNPKYQEIQQILTTGSVEEKVDFLLNLKAKEYISEQQKNISSIFGPLLFAFIILLAFVEDKIRAGYRKLYPTAVFEIGKGIERYKRIKDLREKLIWGGAFALLIAIISGVVVAMITK